MKLELVAEIFNALNRDNLARGVEARGEVMSGSEGRVDFEDARCCRAGRRDSFPPAC